MKPSNRTAGYSDFWVHLLFVGQIIALIMYVYVVHKGGNDGGTMIVPVNGATYVLPK